MSLIFIDEAEILELAGTEERDSEKYLNDILEKVDYVCRNTNGYKVEESFAGTILKSLLVLRAKRIFDEAFNLAQLDIDDNFNEEADDEYLMRTYCKLLEESIENKDSYDVAKEKVSAIIDRNYYEEILKGNITLEEFYLNKGISNE